MSEERELIFQVTVFETKNGVRDETLCNHTEHFLAQNGCPIDEPKFRENLTKVAYEAFEKARNKIT